MVLFKRLPKPRPVPRGYIQHIMSRDDQAHYQVFKEDFETLERVLMPPFRELDNEALRQQNFYRLMYVVLIFGTAMITILAIVQLAIRVDAVGLIEAFVAVALVVPPLIIQSFHSHENYLNARLAAEQLRGEYFAFIARLKPYDKPENRVQELIDRVSKIQEEGGQDDTI